MLVVLGSITLLELCLGLCEVTHPTAVAVCMFVNFWGALDAVLRFPATHCLETFFGVKQVGLFGAKASAFVISALSFPVSIPTLMALLLLDVLGVPLLYLMALPTDYRDTQDPNDVDVVVRAWRLVTSWKERRQCIVACRGWLYRNLTTVSQHSTFACFAVCAASSEHRRCLKARSRCV